MEKELPRSTKVVIIGGGIAGCSVAYHLAKFGWKDVVLLERDQLTSGTTWHAAGLVSQLGATATITKLRKYSLDLYKELEKKTELSSGLKQHGAVSIATTKSRFQELLRQATTAQLFNVDVDVLDVKKIKEIADKVGAIIYEDAAHAFGASFPDGSKVGSCKYSDMTIFSFHYLINSYFFFFYIYFNAVIDNWVNPNTCKTSMSPFSGIKGKYSN